MIKISEHLEQEQLQKKLTRLFHKACADYGLIAEGDHILIGLSGGKDSLLLTELLGRRSRIYVPKFKITAVHVRMEGRKYVSNLGYLEDFCRKYGVPFFIKETSIVGEETKDPCFLCSWYRRKALFDVAQKLGCNKIALGHHRDDVLQTLLMNLIYQGHYGTIPPRLQLQKMPIEMIRPLYLMDEADIKRYTELCSYEKQVAVCEFEHETSRNAAKQLLSEINALNPNAKDSMFGAMTNIKSEYLPK